MRLSSSRALLTGGGQLGSACVGRKHGSELGLRGGFGLLRGGAGLGGGIQLGLALGHGGISGDQGGVRSSLGTGSGGDDLGGFGDLGQGDFLILGTQGIQRALGSRGGGPKFLASACLAASLPAFNSAL